MQSKQLNVKPSLFAKLSMVIWLAGLLLLAGRVPGTHDKPVVGSSGYHDGLLGARETLNSSQFVVTGAPVEKTASGSVPIRRNIMDLHDNYTDQFNLYILGLREFYAADENNEFSYYRIAGIHGRPYGPWGGAEGIPGKQAGYCPHSMILFLTWHRAYLLLYEQVLYQHVANVANSFIPELRDRYVQAAQDFRIPYWDWSVLVDDIIHPIPTYIAEDVEILWQTWTQTLRHPPSDDANATTRVALLYSHFLDYNAQLHNDVGTDMLRNESFNNYSRQHLEMTHNLVHNIAGGGMDFDEDKYWGHVNPLEYSAFDPIFWLHHANVDHIFFSGTYAIPTTPPSTPQPRSPLSGIQAPRSSPPTTSVI